MRVAVIGSGPAGVYAAEALVRYGEGVAVDVLDSLPTPYGLVRYGVAPDHPKTQSISVALAKVLEEPDVRFLGNVRVGADIALDELLEHYTAVLFATGAAVDRHLDVPGEELPGSHSATDFVNWYSGHPDVPPDGFVLDARRVVVVGAGNVAGDVARMLARTPEELATTDVPDHVLEAFVKNQATDIHIVARRGPVQTKFTTRELRELGEMSDADVLLDPKQLVLDPVSEAELVSDNAARRNMDVLRGWAELPPAGRPRRLHLHFFQRPVALLGDGRVTGVQFEGTRLDETGALLGTGETLVIDADAVYRAVGYRGIPLPGLPFDDDTGVVPNDAGRVVRDGEVVPGLYVAGWAKRGPTGVIGTNKHDARETARSLLEDGPALPKPTTDDPASLVELLRARDVAVVEWDGWRAIDAAEAERGRAQGRARSKVSDRDELLDLAGRGSTSGPD